MLSSMHNGSLDALCPCPNIKYSILTRGRMLKSLMGFAHKDGWVVPRAGRVYVAVEVADRIVNRFLAQECGYVEVKYDPTDIRKQKRKEFHVAPEFPKLAPWPKF